MGTNETATVAMTTSGDGMTGDARGSAGLFPASDRVIFQKAPLTQVVTQVQFPPILRIEGEVPAQFQDDIRATFPLLEMGPAPFGLPAPGVEDQAIPPQVMQIFAAAMTAGSAKIYQFLTEDRVYTVTLSQSSLSLSTTNYTRWEEFASNFRIPMAALSNAYAPPFFTRVGLRYVNAIEKTPLGFSAETSWSKLLKTEILGEMSLDAFENNLIFVASNINARLPDDSGRLFFRNGIRTLPGHSEPAYLLDFDFSTDKRTTPADTEALLVHFHRLAGDSFRWCLTERLRDALGPEPA